MERGTDNADGCSVDRVRLAALLDGELAPLEALQLTQHVSGCPRCSACLAEQRAVQTALRQVAATLPPPSHLAERVQAELARAPRTARPSRPYRWRGPLLAAGLAALFAVLALLGWTRFAYRAPGAALVARAMQAHAQETLSAQPVSFTSDNLGAVQQWARRQSGADLDAPSLEAEGYQILGARREPGAARNAVTLVYQGTDGRLTCLLVPQTAPGPLRFLLPTSDPTVQAQAGGAAVVSWTDRDATYVLVGDLAPNALLQLGRDAARAG